MIEYTYRHRVRYRECDPMGVVYHTHFLDYFEASRTEAFRTWGLAYRELEERGIIMPVTDVEIKYHRSAHYDDVLEITAFFNERPGVRVPVEYEVRRLGEPKVLVSGRVTLCFVDTNRNRPTPAPDDVLEVFENARQKQARLTTESIA